MRRTRKQAVEKGLIKLDAQNQSVQFRLSLSSECDNELAVRIVEHLDRFNLNLSKLRH